MPEVSMIWPHWSQVPGQHCLQDDRMSMSVYLQCRLVLGIKPSHQKFAAVTILNCDQTFSSSKKLCFKVDSVSLYQFSPLFPHFY